ncbi:hypothetical protein GGX14DRAFT_392239 [Mycena pura]|uniref:Uncharacterized protein n=1 Tax=Mycena pura TaxID=153505 RepID=A0AAD6VL93_9AGAR|nr:hypothetical protein GGX14DRAFT_392239 [Mycena pura]
MDRGEPGRERETYEEKVLASRGRRLGVAHSGGWAGLKGGEGQEVQWWQGGGVSNLPPQLPQIIALCGIGEWRKCNITSKPSSLRFLLHRSKGHPRPDMSKWPPTSVAAQHPMTMVGVVPAARTPALTSPAEIFEMKRHKCTAVPAMHGNRGVCCPADDADANE